MRLRDLIGIIAFCLPVPSLAQSTNNPLCGVTADAEIFKTIVGKFTLTFGDGVITMMGHVMPFPHSEPFAARIVEWEDRLVLYTETGLLRISFFAENNAKPLSDVSPGTDLQDNLDQRNAASCPNGNIALPYFAGEGQWTSADGVTMSSTAMLVFSQSQEGSVHAWGLIQSTGVVEGAPIEMHAQFVLDADD